MIRCSRRALLMLVALHAAGICAAAAQDLSGLGNGDDPTTVDADQVTYDRLADVVSASGNVVIRRGELELHADEVRVNRGTNEAQARGEVRVLHPEGEIVAEAVDIDLDDEVGFLRRAKLQSSTHRYSLAGDLIEKKEGQEYRISQGCFTTCQCGERRPDWSLSGDELDVTIGGYAHLKGARFNILDVPVLYVPRAIFPVRQERQSGFLRPRFGASNRRGLQAVVPFYWAINKSHDATLAFDVETSARLGALGEYRYQLSRRTGGILRGSYFNELLRGDAEGLS
ncbi:MAG TPA: putative LPS assembly protein LptD, partial [Terriglobales bacterium]|nr:putative LPS assembly protein LptD [Terriglobales bacterium]